MVVVQGHSVLAVILQLLLAGWYTHSTAEAAIYWKLNGIPGESKDSQHVGWIEMTSVEWGMHQQQQSLSSMESMTTEEKSFRSRHTASVDKNSDASQLSGVVFDVMTVNSYYEKSSPKLMQACASNTVFDTAQFDFTYQPGGDTYLKYILKNVKVLDYAVVGFGGQFQPSYRPTVTMKLSFQEITVTYTELNPVSHEILIDGDAVQVSVSNLTAGMV